MRALLLGVFLATLCFSSVAVAVAADAGDAIVGTWLTADGTSKVQIADAQGVYTGHVVWLKEPVSSADGKPKVDRENPDAALRSRPIMGLPVLSGFHYAGDNVWDGGTVYTPATGKSYPCKLTLVSDGSLKLTVGGMVGRTLAWTRSAR
ncbi:MAG: DUF2147 domain-containing protein [Rhodanobacteraceae bacterium]